jgi:hypothetical protein
MEINSNNFKIKFDGQAHQVDAQVLISSLIHTTTVIQELNKCLDTGKKIEIKVNALEKGSFLIHIELLETTLEAFKTIFTKENITVVSSIIAGLVGLIQIKKHLKGKPPKEIKTEKNKTIIKNSDNSQLYINSNIYNIYESNTVIDDALSQNFDIVDNDSAITAFEITDDKEKPYVRVERDDFKDLSQKTEIIDEDNKTKIIIKNTRLNIVRLSFEEGLKWDFYYIGNKISAKITDPNFQKLIDDGKSFAKGDILEVELHINQIFDNSVNTYINKSYQVSRIIQHYSRENQHNINFENNN